MWRPLVVIALVTMACGGGAQEPFELRVAPEFVQGVLPGRHSVLLVSVGSEDDSPVELAAEAGDAQVVVEPERIHPGEVAEVVVVADEVAEDTPLTVTVTAIRGTVRQSAAKEVLVVPGSDTLVGEAGELLDLFTTWLVEERSDLGIGPGLEVVGEAVAPRLLVVSHYVFWSEEWEIGLSWHIMIPPDDWAELYLRPRDEMAPTLGFRLASRQAAVVDGSVDIGEVPAPAEVVR